MLPAFNFIVVLLFIQFTIKMFNNMSKRSHESPMDWEWQNSQGPSDPTSPFTQFRAHTQKRGFDSAQTKDSFVASSSIAAQPFRNPSFTTPRKAFDPDLFSETSGAESSPADNADAEDTPELPKASKAMMALNDESSVKQPIFGRYGAGFLGSSPGRAEQRRGKYGNALVQKVRKRKRIERDYAITQGTRGGSDTESDGESRPRSKGKSKPSKGEGNTPGWWSSFLHGIESHPNLPNILSYYAQLTLNAFLAGLAIFGLWSFWVTIQSDVNKASEDATALVVAEMAKCAKDYVDNGCARTTRPPALETVCDSWEHCMHRDPNSVGRAKISAHTFAQIFNSFIEPISYKAMIFVVLIVTAAILVNNLAFGMFRKPTNPHPVPSYFAPPTPTQHFQWGGPPQTPHHQQNIQYDIHGGLFPAIMPSRTPGQRSPCKGSRSPSKGSRSPSKADRY